MDYAEASEKIRAVLDEKGWRNYKWHPVSKAICLGIAVCAVTEAATQDNHDLIDKVASIICEQFPERVPNSPGTPGMSQIVCFNDAQPTTREDIDLVLGKLAVAS